MSPPIPPSASALRRLRHRYRATLVAIGLTLVVAQGVVLGGLERRAQDAREVNLAGRQRMLSQRIAKQALLLRDGAPGRAARRVRFQTSVREWSDAHHALLHGSTAARTPGLAGHPALAADVARLTPLIDRVGRAATAFRPSPGPGDAAATEAILAAETAFLPAMDRVVFRLDEAAAAGVRRIQATVVASLVLVLALLAALGRLVMAPAVASAERAFAQAAERSRVLRAVIDALPDAVRVDAPDGRTTLRNRAAALAPPPAPGAGDAHVRDTHEPLVDRDERTDDGRWLRVTRVPVVDDGGRLDGVVTVSRDVTERRAMEDRLYHQAHHDALTGLPNRTLFTARLDVAVETGRPYAVLFVDLDRFKAVNDTLGHSAGDTLLQEVARRLERTVRPQDTVARLGGDEFAVLLDGLTSEAHAQALAARLLASLAPPVRLAGQDVAAQASVGIVIGRDDHASSDAVLGEADAAMYRAKSAGRGRASLFDASADGEATRRLRLELDLRGAADRGELRLAYQPIVHLPDGALAGFEALVRWHHPDLGLLAPDAFIAAAEQSGQIVALDRWVLETASRQVAAWRAMRADRPGAPPLVLSVNCTGLDLAEPSYVQAVRYALTGDGMAPGLLSLEVTESLLLADPAAVATALSALQADGARVAIDDFGTGYSSFSALQALPSDVIKVDRSFVAEMESCERNAKLVGAVVGLAHLLGKTVVAEGVETAAQLGALRALGCTYGQGYLFARPLPAEDAEALAAAHALPWAAHWSGAERPAPGA